MFKLLFANYARMRKDKIFWGAAAFMLLISAFYYCYIIAAQHPTSDIYPVSSSEYYFTQFVCILCAVFASFFLGREYGDGVIRNKLIAGHKRLCVYLANLLTVFTATLLFMVMWLIAALVGVVIITGFRIEAGSMAVYILVCVFTLAVYSALFTLIGMLTVNKAVTPVITILVFLTLFLFASSTGAELINDEFDRTHIWVQDESKRFIPIETPNPNYVWGVNRVFLETVMYAMPSGQELMINNKSAYGMAARTVEMILTSAIVAGAVTAAGAAMFAIKDIK